MLKLSERLAAVAFLAGNGGVLADVGTDHGYVPVYLVSEGNFPRAIAMDVNPGPLKSAAAHIVMYGMGDYIPASRTEWRPSQRGRRTPS